MYFRSILTKSRSVGTLALVCVLASATPILPTLSASAQTESAEIVSEVQDMFAWMQEVTDITVTAMSVLDTDLIVEFYAQIDAEDYEGLKVTARKMATRQNQILPGVKARIDHLTPPERWNIDPSLFDPEERAIFKAATLQYEGMNELYHRIEGMTDNMIEMLSDFESLSFEELEELSQLQIETGIAMIDSENQQIRGYLVAIPRDNPNHQLQQLVLQTNLAIKAEMGMALEVDLRDRKKVGREMAKHVRSYESHIEKGRRNAATMLRQVSDLTNNSNLSEVERLFFKNALNGVTTFSEQFDVESEMSALILNSADLYQSDDTNEAIQPLIDEIDVRLFRLLDQRAEILQHRMTLMQG